MGEVRFVVKNPGAASGENGYCRACAQVMIALAQRRLDEMLAALGASSDDG